MNSMMDCEWKGVCLRTMCIDTLVATLITLESDLGILVLLFSRFLDFKFGVFQILSQIKQVQFLSTYLVCTGTPRGPNTPGSLVEIEEAPLSNPTYLLRRALVSLFIVSLLWDIIEEHFNIHLLYRWIFGFYFVYNDVAWILIQRWACENTLVTLHQRSAAL